MQEKKSIMAETESIKQLVERIRTDGSIVRLDGNRVLFTYSGSDLVAKSVIHTAFRARGIRRPQAISIPARAMTLARHAN